MILPLKPWSDATGAPTAGFGQFMQSVATALGGQGREAQIKAVSNTACRLRLRGTDGIWRESADITLS